MKIMIIVFNLFINLAKVTELYYPFIYILTLHKEMYLDCTSLFSLSFVLLNECIILQQLQYMSLQYMKRCDANNFNIIIEKAI